MKPKSFLKNLYYTGLDLAGFTRKRIATFQQQVVGLTYHSVIPESEKFQRYDYRNCVTTRHFDRQIKILKNLYDVVSIEDLSQIFASGRIDGRYAFISFDDGFTNNFKYALPVLKENNVPAVFYINTGYIGKNRLLWTEFITAALIFTAVKSLSLTLNREHLFDLSTPAGQLKASVEIRNYLKQKTFSEAEEIMALIKKQTGTENLNPEIDADRYRFMNWDEVQAMSDLGMIIGSHTHEHMLLNMIPEEQAETELTISKKLIEDHTGQVCRHFSYPNGSPGNFGQNHFRLLERLGYATAATQIKGFNHIGSNPYALSRFNISHQLSRAEFKAMISGFFRSEYSYD